ncbi:MAG: acylglycerol kinase family protein [Comamonadaceae bacterium]|nr:acylglycerol kinase family protein [Comamonadaceae bacterium]
MRQRAAATRTRSAKSSKPRCGLADGAVTCCSAAPPSWPAWRTRLRQGPSPRRTAVVAVGGDGTLNTVAQAAHAAGCAMGVVPQGTFNYFARTHGIPADPADAVAPAAAFGAGAGAGGRPSTTACSWSTPASGSTPTCWKTARPTRPASAAAAGWRSWRPVRRCCARSAGCDCTSRRVARFATCRP